MSTKFILRFDDISPEMAWSRFDPLKKMIESLGVKSVLGVIPDCKDHNLIIEPRLDNFYERVRMWQDYGDSIAQHGTHHFYDSSGLNFLGLYSKSEFVGHSFEKQFNKLKQGKQILVNEGVWQPWFMAPSHSFDEFTIQALKELGFSALTDGYGFYPYKSNSLLLVPQLTSFPINVGFGICTICLHINTMKPSDVLKIKEFILKNKEKFIDFKDVVKQGEVEGFYAQLLRKFSRALFKSYRKIKVR